MFFKDLHEYLLPSDVLIIAGDFNCYDHNLDKFGSNVVPAKCLTDFRSAFPFITVWASFIQNCARARGLIRSFQLFLRTS